MNTARRTALAVLVALVTLLTSIPAASAAALTPNRSVTLTLRTDTLPTRVELAVGGESRGSALVRVCVTYRHGWPRTVRVSNGSRVLLDARTARRGERRCVALLGALPVPLVTVRVVEDLPGPWNPTARAAVLIW